MSSAYDIAIRMYCEKKYDDAIRFFQKLPKSDKIKYNIATCHKEKNTVDSLTLSCRLYEKLLKTCAKNGQLRKNVETNYISANTLISKIYVDQCDYEKAIRMSIDALKFVPQSSVLAYNIGHLYKCIGNTQSAMKYLENALSEDNKHLDTYVEMINIYRDRRDMDKLYECINLGIRNCGENAVLLNDLGLYYVQTNYVRSYDVLTKALTLCHNDQPLEAKIHTNLGHLLSAYGDIQTGLVHYEKAMTLCPMDRVPKQNYLMGLLYVDGVDYNHVIRKHLEIGCAIKSVCGTHKVNILGYNNKKIHIGYVSGDFFGTHPMTYFMDALLNHYSNDRFELYCYVCGMNGDQHKYSKNIKWRIIKYLPLELCKKQILDDKIDILVDLSGHTSGNRIDIFSERLAKLQISYLGYPCITGMPDIDYFVVDRTFRFNCKVAKMEHCYTHYMVREMPINVIQPFKKNNYITFGSFNKLSKINKSVIELWDKVLDMYPTSRFVVKRMPQFKFRNTNRVDVVGLTVTQSEHLEQYNKIDISLDTFPYSGTTTTCESLLMGTPVITLIDDISHAIHQNTTASILSNSNMSEMIAKNPDEYFTNIRSIVEKITTNDNYKLNIRKNFLEGNVTNLEQYIREYEMLLIQLHNDK